MERDDVLTVATLSLPTETQAAHIVRELEFGERFAGHIFKASGAMMVVLYSLKATIAFLANDTTASIEPGAKFLGRDVIVAYIKPVALAEWIRGVLDDAELADAIKAVVAEVPSESGYPPVRIAMLELISQRYLQCMEVLGIDPEPGVEGGTDAEPTGT